MVNKSDIEAVLNNSELIKSAGDGLSVQTFERHYDALVQSLIVMVADKTNQPIWTAEQHYNSIKLCFDKSNNFDAVNPHRDSRVDFARNIKWLLDNAVGNIQKHYTEGAPRRNEMEQMCDKLKEQLIQALNVQERMEVFT